MTMNEDALLSQEMSIRDLLYTYREYIAKFKNIIFWGTGDNAKIILDDLAGMLANDEEKNVSFIDKNPEKFGGGGNGIREISLLCA